MSLQGAEGTGKIIHLYVHLLQWEGVHNRIARNFLRKQISTAFFSTILQFLLFFPSPIPVSNISKCNEYIYLQAIPKLSTFREKFYSSGKSRHSVTNVYSNERIKRETDSRKKNDETRCPLYKSAHYHLISLEWAFLEKERSILKNSSQEYLSTFQWNVWLRKHLSWILENPDSCPTFLENKPHCT